MLGRENEAIIRVGMTKHFTLTCTREFPGPYSQVLKPTRAVNFGRDLLRVTNDT